MWQFSFLKCRKYTLCYRVSWLCSVSCKEMHIGGPRSRKLVRHPPCLKCSATCSHCGIVCYLFIIAIYRPRGGDDESRLLMTLLTQENKNTRLLESSQSVKQEDRFQATLCSLQIAYPGEWLEAQHLPRPNRLPNLSHEICWQEVVWYGYVEYDATWFLMLTSCCRKWWRPSPSSWLPSSCCICCLSMLGSSEVTMALHAQPLLGWAPLLLAMLVCRVRNITLLLLLPLSDWSTTRSLM